MNRILMTSVFAAVLLTGYGLGRPGIGEAVASPLGPPRQGEVGPVRPWLKQWGPVNRAHFMHRAPVLAVTRRSITLRVPARQEVLTLFTADGKYSAEVVRPVIPEQPPITFRASPLLESGEFDMYPVAIIGEPYPLSAVRVGDVVIVGYDKRRGEYICYEVTICRRPGGKVPPAPGENPNSARAKYHLIMNENQEREEKGLGRPKIEPICRGLELVDGVPWLHEDGPWYVRILIPPGGAPGPSPFPPVTTVTPGLSPVPAKP
jgi:hypothetical protein